MSAAARWGVASALMRRQIALWSAQTTFVVKAEGSHIRSAAQVAIAHRRNNAIPDEAIGRRQCLLDTASVGAVGNV